MTDYAIVQLAQTLAPALGILGVGATAVGLAAVFRSSLGKRSAKRLSGEISEMGTRLQRIERALGTEGSDGEEGGGGVRRTIAANRDNGLIPSRIADDSAEIRRRLETLESIVVDKELEGR